MDWIASRAVDGNPDSPHCSRTLTNPLFTHWWQVDLQAIYSVTSVTIDNTDAGTYAKYCLVCVLRKIGRERERGGGGG